MTALHDRHCRGAVKLGQTTSQTAGDTVRTLPTTSATGQRKQW